MCLSICFPLGEKKENETNKYRVHGGQLHVFLILYLSIVIHGEKSLSFV